MDAKEALERLYPAMQDAHVQRSKFYAPRGPVKTEADADNDLDLEALSVLSAVVEDYEKARPLLEAVVMDKSRAKDATSPKHCLVIDAWASVVLDEAESYRAKVSK